MGGLLGRRWVGAFAVGAVLAACSAQSGLGRDGGAALPSVDSPPTSVAAEPSSATAPAPPTSTTVAAEPSYRVGPGVHQHYVNIDGQMRRWTAVVPPVPEGGAPAGVVIVLHGAGGKGADMRVFGFEPLATTGGVVLAYPDGLGGVWNDGRPGADPVMPGVVEDVRFFRMMIQATAAYTGADPTRVGVVGFSNGAMMAGRLACELADSVAAIALVAGSGVQGFEQSCRPGRPVAVMTVSGSADAIVPYAGGKVADWGTRKRGFVAPVEDFFRFWVTHDGCGSTELAGSGPVSESKGVNCRSGSTVLRYRVAGGGHEWFRAPVFDTTNTVWSFLSARLAPAR